MYGESTALYYLSR